MNKLIFFVLLFASCTAKTIVVSPPKVDTLKEKKLVRVTDTVAVYPDGVLVITHQILK